MESFRQLAPSKVSDDEHLLDDLVDLGLVDSHGVTRFRINVIHTQIFITDAPWMLRCGGVFPWEDEALLLLQEIDGKTAERLVDIGVGCGHTLVAAEWTGRRLGIDHSGRAIALAGLNARLNSMDADFAMGDVCDHSFQVPEGSSASLIVANLPFAAHPALTPLPATSAGGTDGLSLVTAFLNAVAARGGDDTRLIALAYTPFDSSSHRTAIEDTTRRIFPGLRVQWRTFENEPMWRVNGTKSQPNPMPLASLARKAHCRFSFAPDDRSAAREGYLMLETELARAGWDSLAFGVLRVGW